MKKISAIVLAILLISVSLVSFAEESNDKWYELTIDNSVLTVRLPDAQDDEIDWKFEISNPEAFELLTHEVVEGENPIYAASFRAIGNAENNVSLILTYGPNGEKTISHRVLELSLNKDNGIKVLSELERDLSKPWAVYDEEENVLLLTLPGTTENWTLDILDPAAIELITNEVVDGSYIGSFMPTLDEFGFAEINVSNDQGTSYSVTVFVIEDGTLSIEFAEVFQVL